MPEELSSFAQEQESLLDRNNVTLYTATTAEDVLAIHRAEHLDLIITDLDAPVMGGDELCRIIRADEGMRKVYIILICSGRTAALQKCDECGANTFITRPLDMRDIAERVSRLLQIPERSDLRVLVKITVHGNFRSVPFFCTSRDISISGVLIDTDKTLARGDEISCSFYLPNTERISVEGEVVRVARGHTSAYNYGFRFTDMTQEAQRIIKKFVEYERATT